MSKFIVLDFSKRKRTITLLILAFCTAFLLIFRPTDILQLFIQTEETALTKGDEENNAMAITFNISWGDEKVHDILKVLKENKTRATFFISGEWAEKHPQIVEKIIEDKHELGMLGYRYQNYLDTEIDQIKKDIIYAKELFKKMGLDNIQYFRPPSGHFDKEIIELVESLDLEVIHWSINPRDWENPGKENIKEVILNESSKGDIVYLHASDSAKQTAAALEKVLPELKERDFKLTTITELRSGITIKKKLVE